MSRSSGTTYKYFGAYLLQKGLVTQEQLEDALKFQEDSNRRIGELAVEKGILTSQQVDEIFREQKEVDMPFGAIALKKRLLHRDVLDDLLFSQAVQSTHLGEALLLRGYLTPEQFGQELQSFKQQEQDRLESLDALVADQGLRDFCKVLVSAFERAYRRFVKKTVKLDLNCRDANPAAFGFCFTLVTDIADLGRVVSSFFLNEAFAGEIAAKHFDACGPGENDVPASWLEFFSIVGHYLGLELEMEGMQVRDVAAGGGRRRPDGGIPEEGVVLGLSASCEFILLHVGMAGAPE